MKWKVEPVDQLIAVPPLIEEVLLNINQIIMYWKVEPIDLLIAVPPLKK